MNINEDKYSAVCILVETDKKVKHDEYNMRSTILYVLSNLGGAV